MNRWELDHQIILKKVKKNPSKVILDGWNYILRWHKKNTWDNEKLWILDLRILKDPELCVAIKKLSDSSINFTDY